MFRTLIFAGLLSLSSLSSSFAQSDAQLRMELIALDSHYQMTIPNAINNRGEVVGTAGPTGTLAGYNVFLWNRRDGFRILAENARAADINDRGDVVGSWLDCMSFPEGGGSCAERGFMWNARAGFRDLGEFSPTAVNDRGDMAGTCVNYTFGHVVPCAMHDGVITVWDCDVAKEPCGGSATGINARGDVVGSFGYFDYPSDAMLWPRQGPAVLLETGTWSYADDINNAGIVAGTSNNRAAVWLKRAVRRRVPEDTFTQSLAINASGVVVGRNLESSSRAFVWDSKQQFFSYLAPQAFYSEATDINDRGTIVGFITDDFRYRAVLWTGSGGTSAR